MGKKIKIALIQALAQGEFVSGQLLGRSLGVSRSAISMQIKNLINMGLDIFSVTGKGYKLSDPMVLLDQKKIINQLSERNKSQNLIEVHNIIDSTNSYLLRKIPNQIVRGQICLAEYQQAGRGRRGRQWFSPFGSHLYLSMYWPLEQGMSQAMGLSLTVGMAVSDTIKSLGINNVQLKWPNDVYIAGKKVAGILIELEGQAQGLSHCVMGIGLNVHMPKVDNGIDQPWDDLAHHYAKKIDRNELAVTLIDCLNKRLLQHNAKGFSDMLDEWHQQDIFLNKPVTVITGDKKTAGIYRGVNEQGAMLLEIAGKITLAYGGEVSLRGRT